MSSREPMYSLRECPIKPVDGKMRQGIIHWQSDYSIVSRKSVKSDGEKGIKEYNLLPEPKMSLNLYSVIVSRKHYRRAESGKSEHSAL